MALNDVLRAHLSTFFLGQRTCHAVTFINQEWNEFKFASVKLNNHPLFFVPIQSNVLIRDTYNILAHNVRLFTSNSAKGQAVEEGVKQIDRYISKSPNSLTNSSQDL